MTRATNAEGCGHTVSDDRWVALKADYARRRSAQLAAAAEHHDALLLARTVALAEDDGR
jgi:hypothetical protein